MIRFKARLQRPDSPARATWTFLVLPAAASRKLPSRGQVAVEGKLGDQPFKAMLDPDGEGGHWLKVTGALRKKAGAEAGEDVALELSPTADAPEPTLPADLRRQLSASPAAKAQWSALTARQRHDWIFWISSAKRAETREKRIASACDMLGSGKRRVCCFDRSGIYSNSLAAPKPAR